MNSDRVVSTANLQMSVLVQGREVKGLDPRTLKMIAYLTALDGRIKGMAQGKWTFDFGEVDITPNLSESFGKV